MAPLIFLYVEPHAVSASSQAADIRLTPESSLGLWFPLALHKNPHDLASCTHSRSTRATPVHMHPQGAGAAIHPLLNGPSSHSAPHLLKHPLILRTPSCAAKGPCLSMCASWGRIHQHHQTPGSRQPTTQPLTVTIVPHLWMEKLRPIELNKKLPSFVVAESAAETFALNCHNTGKIRRIQNGGACL